MESWHAKREQSKLICTKGMKRLKRRNVLNQKKTLQLLGYFVFSMVSRASWVLIYSFSSLSDIVKTEELLEIYSCLWNVAAQTLFCQDSDHGQKKEGEKWPGGRVLHTSTTLWHRLLSPGDVCYLAVFLQSTYACCGLLKTWARPFLPLTAWTKTGLRPCHAYEMLCWFPSMSVCC